MADSTDSYYNRIKHYSAERVAPFNKANQEYPQARETERQLLIESLDINSGMFVVDTNAGGGYLSEGIRLKVGGDVRIACVDPAENFTAALDESLERVTAPLHDMHFENESVNWVTNLVGLHHLSNKKAFYNEAYRILAPGAGVAFADVQTDSPAAKWLNGPVDRFTDIGHDGMFFSPGEFTRDLEACGFVNVDEKFIEYTWDFPDKNFMAQFCSDLFRLSRATLDEVLAALEQTLNIQEADGVVKMGWGLIYVKAFKPKI